MYMTDEACRALQHVHNKVDTEAQWSRAVGCLQTMTDLQIALAWQTLSTGTDPVALSQYKMLFKRALRAGGQRWVADHTPDAKQTVKEVVTKEHVKNEPTNTALLLAVEECARELFHQQQENERLHSRNKVLLAGNEKLRKNVEEQKAIICDLETRNKGLERECNELQEKLIGREHADE